MADKEATSPTESFRRPQGARKRREPPIIDATATEIADRDSGTGATSPAATPEPAVEPTLFGSKPSDPGKPADTLVSGTAEKPLPEPSLERGPEKTDGPATPDEVPGGSVSVGSSPSPGAPSGDLVGDEAPDDILTGASDTSLPPPSDEGKPRTPHRSPLALALSTVVVLLLGAIAWLLFNDTQGSRVDELAAAVDALNGKVATLEARPAAPDDSAKIAAIDGRASTLADQVAALQGSVADLGRKVDAAEADARSDADRLSSLEAKVAGGAAQAPNGASASQPGGEAQNPAPPESSANDSGAALTALSTKVDDLGKRIADLPPAANLSPLQTKLDELAGRVDSVQATVAALPKIDLDPLHSRLDGLDRRLTESDGRQTALSGTLATLTQSAIDPLRQSVADLGKRIEPLEAALSTPKNGDRVTEARAVGDSAESRAAPLAVVSQAVASAIEGGRPFAQDLAALRALGADEAAVAPLDKLAEKGAPTLDDLKARWTAAEPAVLAATRPTGQTTFDRLAAGARNLVQIRPVGTAAAQGDDPAALARRIGSETESGDLEAALADWDRLPEAGRKASADWAQAARDRQAAEAAVRSLQSQAIATLGKAKG